ncbi:MAG: hypothetical protein J6V32_02255 [Elusimicrobiaceae bacterium]|nr:hypothetical protein [Elusimicrobiaceae bacterium]
MKRIIMMCVFACFMAVSASAQLAPQKMAQQPQENGFAKAQETMQKTIKEAFKKYPEEALKRAYDKNGLLKKAIEETVKETVEETVEEDPKKALRLAYMYNNSKMVDAILTKHPELANTTVKNGEDVPMMYAAFEDFVSKDPRYGEMFRVFLKHKVECPKCMYKISELPEREALDFMSYQTVRLEDIYDRCKNSAMTCEKWVAAASKIIVSEKYVLYLRALLFVLSGVSGNYMDKFESSEYLPTFGKRLSFYQEVLKEGDAERFLEVFAFYEEKYRYGLDRVINLYRELRKINYNGPFKGSSVACQEEIDRKLANYEERQLPGFPNREANEKTLKEIAELKQLKKVLIEVVEKPLAYEKGVEGWKSLLEGDEQLAKRFYSKFGGMVNNLNGVKKWRYFPKGDPDVSPLLEGKDVTIPVVVECIRAPYSYYREGNYGHDGYACKEANVWDARPNGSLAKPILTMEVDYSRWAKWINEYPLP